MKQAKSIFWQNIYINKTLPEIKKVLMSTKKIPYETNKWQPGH